MYRANRCPKCGYASETAFEICMKCGVVVEKFLLKRTRAGRMPTRPVEADTDSPASICATLFYIVWRGWLWPVPLILVQTWILLNSEAIWTTKAAFTSGRTIHESIAGDHAIIGLVFLSLSYWFTYTPLFSTLMETAEGVTSEASARCAVVLLRALVFSALCWNTYVMVVKYGLS